MIAFVVLILVYFYVIAPITYSWPYKQQTEVLAAPDNTDDHIDDHDTHNDNPWMRIQPVIGPISGTPDVLVSPMWVDASGQTSWSTDADR